MKHDRSIAISDYAAADIFNGAKLMISDAAQDAASDVAVGAGSLRADEQSRRSRRVTADT